MVFRISLTLTSGMDKMRVGMLHLIPNVFLVKGGRVC